MADEHRDSRTVAELKEYLTERGIQTSIYNRERLVVLASAAADIGLEPESDPLDVKREHDHERRTIVLSTGETTLLPDVKDITDWQCDLAYIPNIEMGDIMVYLMTSCGWIKSRLSSYKNDNSYKLFENKHVDNVMLKTFENDYTYVMSTCLPETRQNEKPYQTWLLLSKDGSVKSGGCTCVA